MRERERKMGRGGKGKACRVNSSGGDTEDRTGIVDGTGDGLISNNTNKKANQGDVDNVYYELWHACAGPLVKVPQAGDLVIYFPQGHMEQVEAYTCQDGKTEMPIYNLPYKILCKVVYVQLKVTLLPEVKQDGPSPEEKVSPVLSQKSSACYHSKKLTPSDTSTHGGFSVPKRLADDCLPHLDMSVEIPQQELVARDLHGFRWSFKHIYRGNPKRHLITSGWSQFLNAKKLNTGDACIFLRGEDGGLHVGIRRLTKQKHTASASVISGSSMQHGILASAFHAVSTGTMFTVYYRPWTSPSAFIVPYDQYMKSTALSYSVGMRFKMTFEGEECQEQKFAGTVVGIEDIDPIRWSGSEWRRLEVQWDAPSETSVRPGRVSPWDIEPTEVSKKKNMPTKNLQKRAPPIYLSSSGHSTAGRDDLLQCPGESTPQRHGVLKGQEERILGVNERGPLRPPMFLVPSPHLDWGRTKTRLEKHMHFPIPDSLNCGPGSILTFSDGKRVGSGISNMCSPPFTSSEFHDGVGASRTLAAPNVNSSNACTQERTVPNAKDETEVPLAQQYGRKITIFGVEVDICKNPLELPSQQVTTFGELPKSCAALPTTSQSSTSIPVQVSESSKSASEGFSENQRKNCCTSAN
ncbi:B3 DNA binding domain [Dillenia turbinata]|uniref:Auxin response factor n=1 Tax=Dillenia turbinata TaxID=194707 RepID=A0AAN8VWM1_9MAGN